MKIIHNKKFLIIICLILILALIIAGAVYSANNKVEYWTGYAMSTVINQTAYGPNAFDAMREAQKRLATFEKEMSMFDSESEVYKINQMAGNGAVKVSEDVFDMLQTGKKLSQMSDGAFQLTIAPVTQLWGITSDTPHVPDGNELAAAMQLVNDDNLILNETDKTVSLVSAGQAIDLGGIAKGRACDVVKQVYDEFKIKSAVLSIGGNIYVHGTKPNGDLFKIGFRDPRLDENSYIASVKLQDTVFAVSGGYERNFTDEDGNVYHHIIDPKTGYPAISDIVSIGVVCADGATADFYSTTFFVWGTEKTLQYVKSHPELQIMLLDENNNLYVSQSLENVFEMHEENKFKIIFV